MQNLVWPITHNLSGLVEPARAHEVPAGIACGITQTHKPPRHGKALAYEGVFYLKKSKKECVYVYSIKKINEGGINVSLLFEIIPCY